MPDWGPGLRARLATLKLSPTREAEIVEELSLHLEDRWRECTAAGMTDAEAERHALAAFTDDELLARALRPLRQNHWTDPAPPAAARNWSWSGLGADVRQAIRALRGAPSFTIAALLVLALGIGASTAIFSVVDAVALRDLPFDEPDRLVAVGERAIPAKGPGPAPIPAAGKGGPSPSPEPRAPSPQGGPKGSTGPQMPASLLATDPDALRRLQPQNYLDWMAQQQSFESIAAIAGGEYTLSLPGAAPESIVAQRVTASFFDVLRIRPAVGRAFTVDNEVDGHHRLVILTDQFWRRRLNASPTIVGQTLSMEGGVYEVIGVLAPDVTYPIGASRPPDVFVPYVVPASERMRGRGVSIYLESIARLKPGVSIEQANADMRRVSLAIQEATEGLARTNAAVRPLKDHLVGASVHAWMLMLLSAVGLVLLIACANVANLMLARASARGRDIAVRAALGAGRWRLIRQCLVESVVLAAAGTALAVLLASGLVTVLRAAMPDDVPRVATIALNIHVLTVAVVTALATGMLLGIVPALSSSKPDLVGVLNESARGGGAARGRARMRAAVVVAEVALAIVLLVGAALFITSFSRLLQLDPRMKPQGVLTAQIQPSSLPGERPPDQTAALIDIAARLGQVSGVRYAAVSAPGIPLRVNQRIDALRLPGQSGMQGIGLSIKTVTSEYHRALGIPLTAGRLFDSNDGAGGAPVVILNESAAALAFPGERAVGRTVVVYGPTERTVVGIVGNARLANLEADPGPEVYLPLAQASATSGYLVIRTDGDPYSALPAVRTLVASVFADVPLRSVATMEELVAGQTAQRRVTMLMLSLFGLLGLVISAVGVYGVMAYSVTARRREIGVRMALGATRSRVMAMVIRQAGLLVAIGVVLGGAGAWYLARLAEGFLFGMDAHDLGAFMVAIGALVAAALVASLIPAVRAASVDPTVTLRAE